MKLLRWNMGAVTALALFVLGCGPVEESSPPTGGLITQEAGLSSRACVTDLDCRSLCECSQGSCKLGMVGPPPPGDHCAQPPQRACSSGADCASGCNCVSSVCVDDGIGPATNCLLAPPDAFENDNTHQTASAYGGPQLKHTFHRQGDVDWMLVYTPNAQVMTVEAYNARAQMRLELYAYNYATRTLGALLASTQSTVCTIPVDACWRYKIAANVVAGGAYVVKVTDVRPFIAGSDWRPSPSYDLKMY